MRSSLLALCILCTLAGASAVSAGPITDSVAFQGRITDASGVPLADGARDLILSVWTDSVGGTMLYSEVRAVTTADGLYSTCLGCNNDAFFGIVTDTTLFLEVALAGQPPIAPRTALRYAPRAMMAARVRGDISTSPDHLTVGDLDGDGMLDLISTADASEMTVARKRPGKVKYQNITLRAFADSTLDTRDCDDDDDGIAESSYLQRLTPTTASLSINTKGTGAKRLSMGGDCDDTDAAIYLDCDDDGDGVSESSVTSSSSSEGSSLTMEALQYPAGLMGPRMSTNVSVNRTIPGTSWQQGIDLDDDGVSETSMTSTVERKSGSIIYLDREGNEVLRSMLGVDSTRSIIMLDRDFGGDGVPEVGTEFSTTPTRTELKQYFQNGDIPTQSQRTSAVNDTGISDISTVDADSDGDPEGEISQTLTPVSSNVAIKTKGTKADANRVVGSTDDSTATVLLSADSASISMRTKHTGVIKGAININHANRSMVDVSVEDTATSVASSLDLDGDAQQDIGIIESCTADSTIREVTYSYPNSATPSVLMKAKEKANRTKCSNNLKQISALSVTETEVGCDSAGASTFWRADDFSGAITSVTIQASTDPSVNPIEHSSGAHLTPGGAWTNASDENLKENFAPVDGHELLEKIDNLEITRWNYKTDPETEHIGPTAQDFQATFGVGSDGTSISTIDPSGIALAAIKVLSKQNSQLRSQNADLQKQLDELRRMVARLAEKR